MAGWRGPDCRAERRPRPPLDPGCQGLFFAHAHAHAHTHAHARAASAPAPFVRVGSAQASLPSFPSPYAGRGDRWPFFSDRRTEPRSVWRRRISSPGVPSSRAISHCSCGSSRAEKVEAGGCLSPGFGIIDARTSASFFAFVRSASANPFQASACASVILSSARRKAMRPSTRSMVAMPSMPPPIMPILCIIPMECIMDMLPIISFMSSSCPSSACCPYRRPSCPRHLAARRPMGSVREPEWPELIFRRPRGGNDRVRPGPAPTPEPQVPRP